MPMHTRVSGSWKEIPFVHVRVSGAWKKVLSGYVRVSGAWKQFYVLATLGAGNGGTVAQSDGSGGPYNTTVAIRFNTDGTVETGKSVSGAALTWTAAGHWIDPQSQASEFNCSVRYTNLVSVGEHDFTSKAANQGDWVSLGSTTRTWAWNETSGTIVTENDFTCNFRVRDDDGLLDTATEEYTFRIDNSF
jgi:hypothetical protein